MGRKNRSFSAGQIRAALAAYRTGAALLVIEAETGVPRTVLAYHRRKMGIPRRRSTREEVGVATERARLRPLLERLIALFDDGDVDATGPSAGMRVGPVVSDLRVELGKEE